MLNEDAIPTNCVASGAVAGIGVPPQSEPGVNKKKKLKVILANAQMLTRKPDGR